jgi:branched-chain amino acid transport system substrate-binding protein
VQFDKNGDVSAPAVTWTFSESGIEEQKYISLTEVNDFMASLN